MKSFNSNINAVILKPFKNVQPKCFKVFYRVLFSRKTSKNYRKPSKKLVLHNLIRINLSLWLRSTDSVQPRASLRRKLSDPIFTLRAFKLNILHMFEK